MHKQLCKISLVFLVVKILGQNALFILNCFKSLLAVKILIYSLFRLALLALVSLKHLEPWMICSKALRLQTMLLLLRLGVNLKLLLLPEA